MACMYEYTWSRTVSVDAALGQTFCTPTPRRAPPLLRGIQLGCSSSVRAWSIWSYAYVTMAAVVIVSPLRASDS